MKIFGLKIREISIMLLVWVILLFPLAIFTCYDMNNAYDFLLDKYAKIGIAFVGITVLIVIKRRKKKKKFAQPNLNEQEKKQ